MHPVMKPALRRGWRDLNTVQFGMTPAHALTLGPVATATGSFLELLDGTRGLPLLREEGRRMDVPDDHVDALVERLTRAGLVDDARGGGPDADALRERTDVLERLRPDLASLSLTTSEPGGALARLAARRARRVQVRGAGRVGALLASVLSGAGVGEVDVRDVGRVEPWDVAPGGLPADSLGTRRDAAARNAVRRAAPDRPPRRTSSPGPGPGPEEPGLCLVILAPRDDVAVHAPDPFTAEPLMASGTPHLYAGVVEARASSARSCCPASRPVPAVCTRTARTGTRSGPGWSPSGAPAGPAGSGRVTWLWPRRSPVSPRHTPWPSSTGSRRPAREPAGRSLYPV